MLGLRLALNKDLSWMPRLDGSVEWKIYWTDSTRRQKKKLENFLLANSVSIGQEVVCAYCRILMARIFKEGIQSRGWHFQSWGMDSEVELGKSTWMLFIGTRNVGSPVIFIFTFQTRLLLFASGRLVVEDDRPIVFLTAFVLSHLTCRHPMCSIP